MDRARHEQSDEQKSYRQQKGNCSDSVLRKQERYGRHSNCCCDSDSKRTSVCGGDSHHDAYAEQPYAHFPDDEPCLLSASYWSKKAGGRAAEALSSLEFLLAVYHCSAAVGSPNGVRLSGARKRVRCSRGLGDCWHPRQRVSPRRLRCCRLIRLFCADIKLLVKDRAGR